MIDIQLLFDVFVPSGLFAAEYLSLLVFSFLFAYILKLFFVKNRTKRSFSAFSFIYNLFTNEKPLFRRPTLIGQFFVLNLLFLFFIKNILSNNIKTSKVIVDVNQLIDGPDKIYKTDRGNVIYYHQDEIEKVS